MLSSKHTPCERTLKQTGCVQAWSEFTLWRKSCSRVLSCKGEHVVHGSTAGNFYMTENHCEEVGEFWIMLLNYSTMTWLHNTKLLLEGVWRFTPDSIDPKGKNNDVSISLLPCRSCGQTRPEHDSWTALCSRRWRCSGPGDTEPQTCRSWLAHPGIHAAPGMGASWVGRQTQPALKALILAWECYSNQTRGTGFLDPEWQVSFAIPNE